MKALTRKPRSTMGLFEEFFTNPFLALSFDNVPDRIFDSSMGARANVSKTETGYVIEIEAPGMQKEDFNVKLDGDVLTVSSYAERKRADVDRKEFFQRSFSRSWTLPAGVKEDGIDASYVAGILRLDVPVSESPPDERVRVIDVK